MEQIVEVMSRENLAREVVVLREKLRVLRAEEQGGTQQLLNDLKLHQVELEAQNIELRRIQAELEESRNRYTELYDFAPVGYCTLSPKGVIQELNLTAGAMLGYDRGWLVGTPLTVALPPAQRTGFHNFLADCLVRGGEASFEATLSGRPGSPASVQFVATPRRSPDGTVTGFLLAITDIATLKELQGRLRMLADLSEQLASRSSLEDTLGHVARTAVPFLADLCFVDVLDQRGEVRRLDAVVGDLPAGHDVVARLNHAALADGGSPQTQVIDTGQPVLYPVLAPLVAEHSQRHPLAEALHVVGVRSMMVVPLTTRGRTFGALSLGTCRAGKPYTADDLTFAQELARRAAAAVEAAQVLAAQQRNTRAREDLLAVVSHDLKSPLTVIQMSLASVLRGWAEPNDRRRRGRRELSRIRHASERMTVLINDLLDAASIEAGSFAVEPGRTALGQLLVDAVEMLAPLAAAKEITLVADCPPCPDVRADPGRVQQVLANLVGNAIKFTPGGGMVTVGAEPAGDFVRVWVRDTGPGIPADAAAHVFDRFWKARRGLRSGSGLGLFISQGIVAAHGGRIWVDTKLDQGSEFSFTLPHATAEDPPARAALPRELLDEALVKHVPSGHPPGAEANETSGRSAARSWLDREHLAIVSHELRGPLTALALQLDKLSSPNAELLTPRQATCVRRAAANLARLGATVETLLQQALLDYGALRPSTRPFDVVEIAADLLEVFRPLADRKGIKLRLGAERGRARPLESDPELVRLMMTHLVLNGIRRSPKGVVELSVADRRLDWRLAVKDLGPTLSATEQVRAFDCSNSAGPGLALVRELALALGGHVEVASVRSRGTSFAFTLPLKLAPGRR